MLQLIAFAAVPLRQGLIIRKKFPFQLIPFIAGDEHEGRFIQPIELIQGTPIFDLSGKSSGDRPDLSPPAFIILGPQGAHFRKGAPCFLIFAQFQEGFRGIAPGFCGQIMIDIHNIRMKRTNSHDVMVDGVTQLIMMKSDVMNDFDTIKVATGYKINGEVVNHFPYELTDDLEPVYTEFKGWKCDICKVRRYEDFPVEFKEYVEFIERETGCPIKIISVGPDREETIVR